MRSSINVNEFITDLEKWEELYNFIDKIIEQKICTPGWRDIRINFKFSDKMKTLLGGFTYNLPLMEFMTQWIMWRPYATFRGYLTKDDFERKIITNITNNKIADYCNRHYVKPKFRDDILDIEFDIHDKNSEINEIIEYMGRLSSKYGDLLAIGTSILDVVDVMNKSEEFYDLMHYEFPTLPQKEIEEDIKEKGARVKQLLSEHSDIFRILIKSNILKSDQFIKYYFSIGFQSDLSGRTITHGIKSSYLNKGMQSKADYAVDLYTANKALTYNKTNTGKAGYQQRKLQINSEYTQLYSDSCDSEVLLEYEVKSEPYLKIINTMNMVLDDGSLHPIEWTEDKDLIGKTIKLKNPLTCANKIQRVDNKGILRDHVIGICKDCYGGLYETNSKHVHIGELAAAFTGSIITQTQLSSKHSLSVDSESVNIIVDDGKDDSTIFMYKSDVFINTDDINHHHPIKIKFIDELNENEEDNISCESPSFNKIILKYINKDGDKVKKVVESADSAPIFFIHPELMSYKLSERDSLVYNESDVELKIGITEDEEQIELAMINIQSKELNSSLIKLNNIFEVGKAKFNGEKIDRTNINKFVEILSDVLVESKLDSETMLLQFLIVLRQCVRKEDDIVECADFSNPNEKAVILTLSDSIYNAPTTKQRLTYEKMTTEVYNNPDIYRLTSGHDIDKLLYQRLI